MKKMILLAILLSSTAAFATPYRNMYVAVRTVQNIGSGTPNSCLLQLAEYDLNYAIEWQVSDIGPEWTETHPSSGRKIVTDDFTACSNTTSCSIHGERNYSKASMFINKQGQKEYFKPHKDYYFAARQFIDSNKNGTQDPGEFVREWSTPTQVFNSGDFNHRCTFNTFPAQ